MTRPTTTFYGYILESSRDFGKIFSVIGLSNKNGLYVIDITEEKNNIIAHFTEAKKITTLPLHPAGTCEISGHDYYDNKLTSTPPTQNEQNDLQDKYSELYQTLYTGLKNQSSHIKLTIK